MKPMNVLRSALAAASMLALSACWDRSGTGSETNSSAEEDDRGSNRDQGSDRDRDSERDRESDRDSGGDRDSRDSRSDRGSADPDILAQIEQEIEPYRRELPQRSGPMTITDVELVGSELIYDQRSDMNLTSNMVDRIEGEVRRQLCEAETRAWIRGGVTVTYRLVDPDGDRYRLSIDSCSGA